VTLRTTAGLAGRMGRVPLAIAAPRAQIAIGFYSALAGGAAQIPLIARGESAPFLTLYPAVALASWAGGLLGGVAACLAAEIIAIYLFIAPQGVLSPSDDFAIIGFVIGGLLIAGLGGHLHESLRAAALATVRASWLADASAILGSTLEPRSMAFALARATVPVFADRCRVELVDDQGRAIDAVREPRGPLAERARGGRAREAPTQLLVPLVAGGRAIGSMTFEMVESGRRFGDDDASAARDLAGRAAVALDRARLFRAVKARRDELDAVIDAMTDGVVIADGQGRIESHNPAAVRILGPELPERLDDLLASLSGGPGAAAASKSRPTDRHVVPIVLDVDGDEPHRVAILRDVTEVFEGDAARDAFISMLSHEIRTPITTIFGAARILQRPLAEEVRASLIGDLIGETDRLFRLVEDMLVLSRFERGRLEVVPEPLLVHRLLARLVESERSRWPTLRIALDVPDTLSPVNADPTYVEQVVRNLISNAAKYAGADASVAIGARNAAPFVEIDVEDDGPGIAPQEDARAFDLYERLVEPSVPTPGTGVGLFVCRRLVDSMGGTIAVDRGTLGGARFRFTLPILPPDGDAEGATTEP
jgi:signal transduction histidine kinase